MLPVSNTGINIHIYDGKIDKSDASQELERAYSTPKNTKFQMLENLYSYVVKTPNELKTQQGLKCMRMLIDEFARTEEPRTKSGPNWDSSNELFADDLLFLSSEMVLDPRYDQFDILHILNLQFTEMATGMCPQGRATRMWQLYVTFPKFELVKD